MLLATIVAAVHGSRRCARVEATAGAPEDEPTGEGA